MSRIRTDRTPVNQRRHDLITTAATYKRNGWKVVPIRGNAKKPTDTGWPNNNYDDHPWDRWDNIGVQMGEVSAGLCDVDIDCLEALQRMPSLDGNPSGTLIASTSLISTRRRTRQPYNTPISTARC